MSNLYRGPSIDPSYQVSVHLATRFQRRYLEIGQSEARIAYGGHFNILFSKPCQRQYELLP
jgi:hypothetical protein